MNQLVALTQLDLTGLAQHGCTNVELRPLTSMGLLQHFQLTVWMDLHQRETQGW